MTTPKNLASKYEYLIARAVNSTEGRVALATMMVQPIRKALDYLGLCRKVVQVDYIPDGVFAVYEKDIDSVAITIPKKGASPTPQIEGDQVAVETFEIGVNPEILRSTVRKRRFNVINRIQARSRATIQEEEDKHMFELLGASFAGTNPDGNFDNVAPYAGATFTGDLTKDPISEAITQMWSRNVIPTKMIMHPSLVKGLMLLTNADYDPITQHQVNKTGLVGKMLGLDIYMSNVAPTDQIFLTSEPEFLGVMPIREDVTVLDNPNNTERKLGWSIFEEVGFAVLNNSGVNQITQS